MEQSLAATTDAVKHEVHILDAMWAVKLYGIYTVQSKLL